MKPTVQSTIDEITAEKSLPRPNRKRLLLLHNRLIRLTDGDRECWVNDGQHTKFTRIRVDYDPQKWED